MGQIDREIEFILNNNSLNFVRPVLTYGLENYVLNKKQIRKLQTTEGTIMKKMLNLNNKSRTTSLLQQLDLKKLS